MLLRAAEPDDALDVARVHVRSWQAGYRGLLPDEYLGQLRPEDRAPHYDFATDDPAKPHTIVAVEDSRICGFATTMPARDTYLVSFGELVALYVDPNDWGCGIGVALVAAARAKMIAGGFEHAVVWVLAGNVRAMRFYERDAWTCDGTEKSEEMWGISLQSVRYRRSLAESLA
ncbi:MAG TPA: GNAT family N-acetyltransferase [Terracidiphilus sp.]|jgi:GNAT superfamily N-acetyltransferase|nr:GNAT family N-acetyltransferase [Terracidiphilus sp.]